MAGTAASVSLAEPVSLVLAHPSPQSARCLPMGSLEQAAATASQGCLVRAGEAGEASLEAARSAQRMRARTSAEQAAVAVEAAGAEGLAVAEEEVPEQASRWLA